MFLTKVIFLVFVSVISVSNANIVITMEPDELQSIGEMLVRNQLRIEATAKISTVKKYANMVIQLMGITISLVGANMITGYLDAYLPQKKYAVDYPTNNNYNNNTSASASNRLPNEICQNNFGCDRGLCWRSCDDKAAESWCYTAPKTIIEEFKISASTAILGKTCKHHFDCSPCWSCLGVCNTIHG